MPSSHTVVKPYLILEILHNIISHLDRRQDLLSLALSSKFLYTTIIPRHLDYCRIGCMPHVLAVWEHLLGRIVLCDMVKELILFQRFYPKWREPVPRYIPRDIKLDGPWEVTYVDPYEDTSNMDMPEDGYHKFLLTWPLDYERLSPMYKVIPRMHNLRRLDLKLEILSDGFLKNLTYSFRSCPLEVLSLDFEVFVPSDGDDRSNTISTEKYLAFSRSSIPSLTSFTCVFRDSTDQNADGAFTRYLIRFFKSLNIPNLTYLNFHAGLSESLFLELLRDDYEINGRLRMHLPWAKLSSLSIKNPRHIRHRIEKAYSYDLEELLTTLPSLTSLEILDAVLAKPFNNSTLAHRRLTVFRTLAWPSELDNQHGVTQNLVQLDIAGGSQQGPEFTMSTWVSSSPSNPGFPALKSCVLPRILPHQELNSVKDASEYLCWLRMFVSSAPNLESFSFRYARYGLGESVVVEILRILRPLTKLSELKGLILNFKHFSETGRTEIIRNFCQLPSLRCFRSSNSRYHKHTVVLHVSDVDPDRRPFTLTIVQPHRKLEMIATDPFDIPFSENPKDKNYPYVIDPTCPFEAGGFYHHYLPENWEGPSILNV